MKRIELLEDRERWTEATMARALIHSQLFARQILVVPNTSWPGHECDLLAVDSRNLKLIEVEIKISRADLLADAHKDKWRSPWWERGKGYVHADARRPLDWPHRIWKHYYLIPERLRVDDLYERIPRFSGILRMHRNHQGKPHISCVRRCQGNRNAEAITAAEAIDIARLAGLRMWDALLRGEKT